MNKFHHKGSLGDIIYSLPTIIAKGGGELFLRKKSHFMFLESLLRSQEYIKNVYCEAEIKDEDLEEMMMGFMNLDGFRRINKKDRNKHLAKCHLEIFNLYFDISKNWLYNIPAFFRSKIVIGRTERYHDQEEINWALLKDFKSNCLFLGFKEEYDDFYYKYGIDMPFYVCKDGLEMASIVQGSNMVIGNQSFLFSIAEALKKPRFLEVFYSKNNCLPQSDNGYTSLTIDLIEKYLVE